MVFARIYPSDRDILFFFIITVINSFNRLWQLSGTKYYSTVGREKNMKGWVVLKGSK
jgi:hypothetical protein